MNQTYHMNTDAIKVRKSCIQWIWRTFNDNANILLQYFYHLFNKQIWIEMCIYWVEKTYFLVSGLYMWNKSYFTKFLCLSLYFFIRLYRVLNFFLYDTVSHPVIHDFRYKASVEHGNEYNIPKGSYVSQGGTMFHWQKFLMKKVYHKVN